MCSWFHLSFYFIHVFRFICRVLCSHTKLNTRPLQPGATVAAGILARFEWAGQIPAIAAVEYAATTASATSQPAVLRNVGLLDGCVFFLVGSVVVGDILAGLCSGAAAGLRVSKLRICRLGGLGCCGGCWYSCLFMSFVRFSKPRRVFPIGFVLARKRGNAVPIG